MKRHRILKYPWHTAHDYELAKLPHHFYYLSNTCRRWATSHRPIPESISWVSTIDEQQTDVMILHADQWTYAQPSKRFLLERFIRSYQGPKIVINHGCNMVDGCTSEQMKALVGDAVVVCNSQTAVELWNLPNSHFIRHGMSPEEWPQTSYERANVVLMQPDIEVYANCHNRQGADAVAEQIELDWIGKSILFTKFEEYRAFLATSSVFLNISYASCNPRSRTEAMLCGLVVVTTNRHQEDEYIENGVNGFCSNDVEEIIEFLRYLKANPKAAEKIGVAGRETAQNIFHIDAFCAQWNDLLKHTLS